MYPSCPVICLYNAQVHFDTSWKQANFSIICPCFCARKVQKCVEYRLRVVPIFLRDSRASETRSRVKIIPREKGETRQGERRLAFLAWGDFHARSRFARSAIPEGKWGLLVVWSCMAIAIQKKKKREIRCHHLSVNVWHDHITWAGERWHHFLPGRNVIKIIL